jgi:hypothetical protein
MTSMMGAKDPSPAEETALHEMLHLLMADVLSVAAKRRQEAHPDVVLEEHRAIERLVNVLKCKGGK